MPKSSCFLFVALLTLSNIQIPSASGSAAAAAFSFRQFALEAGYGTGIRNTSLLRLDSQWDLLPRILRANGFEVCAIGQLSGGIWSGDRDILDLSATPIFRLQSSSVGCQIRPYFEAAIGFHYISAIQMRNRVFSTNFQFGDHLGIGVVIGNRHSFDLCYQFQHLSNASIRRPNSGINFHIVRLGYSF